MEMLKIDQINSSKKIHIIEKKAYRISICYKSIVQLLEVQKKKKESQLDSYYFLSAGQKEKKDDRNGSNLDLFC